MKNEILARLTIREIKKNALQFVSMVVIVFLASTLVCGFVANTITLQDAVQSFYEQTNLSDLTLTLETITEEDTAYFDELGITYAYRTYAEGSTGKQKAKFFVGGSGDDENTISRPYLTKGNFSGVVVDENIAVTSGYSIGSTITVTIDTYSFDVKITGYMVFCETLASSTYALIYASEEYFQSVLTAKYYGLAKAENYRNQIIMRCDVDTYEQIILEHYEDNENFVYLSSRGSGGLATSLDAEITQSVKMIYVFPIIFLLVAVFVMIVTANRLILDDRTEIGTLKGIGFSKKEILIHYALFSGVLAIIGCVMGAIAGPIIVPTIMKIKYTIVYGIPFPSSPSFSIPISILVTLLIALLSGGIGLLECSSVVKLEPADSMKPIPPEKRKMVPTQKYQKKWDSIGFSTSWLSTKMALRNILIEPTRAVVTIVGVAGCVALLVCAFGIGDTIDYSVCNELYYQFSYDISSSYTNDDFLTSLDEMVENGVIEKYETFTTYYVRGATSTFDQEIRIYNLSANMTMTTIDTDGTIVMSEQIAGYFSIKVGDEIKLSYNGKVLRFTIEKIVKTSVTRGVFVCMDESVFDGFYGIKSVYIKGEGTSELVEKLNSISGGTASTVSDTWDYIQDKISSITMIQYTLIIFAVLLSVVVLYNLSLLNLTERTRDIATMKVLGIKNRKIAGSLLLEILILTGVGTICGLILGHPILLLLLKINEINIITYLPCIKVVSFIYSASISIFTAVIINSIFARFIPKINMTESLKSVV